MDQTTLAFLTSSGGWILALFLAFTSYYERRSTAREQHILSALDYLTGGTQRRSIGIAIIEGMWPYSHRFRRTLIPALTNQAVYLLLESGAGTKRHEFHNWLRIMDLIMRVKPHDEYRDFYIEILEALQQRIDKPRLKGIVIEKVQAQLWIKKFQQFSGISMAA